MMNHCKTCKHWTHPRMMEQYEELEVALFNDAEEVNYKGYKRQLVMFIDDVNASTIMFPQPEQGDGATVTHIVVLNKDGSERKRISVFGEK